MTTKPPHSAGASPLPDGHAGRPRLARQALDKLRAALTILRGTARRLWRAHLDRLESSPRLRDLLLAVVELTLGHRLDLQQLLARLVTRLRRNPPDLSDPEGWAY